MTHKQQTNCEGHLAQHVDGKTATNRSEPTKAQQNIEESQRKRKLFAESPNVTISLSDSFSDFSSGRFGR
jgi:hypothetical protein